MLLGTLGPSLLGNLLTGKGIYRARKSKGVIAKSQGPGINRAAEGVLRAGYGPSSSSALQTKFDFNTTSSFN